MQALLEELHNVNGVIGSYLFSCRNGVLSNTLPSLFRSEKLQALGRMLAKIHAAGRANFPDLAEGTLAFEEIVLVFRETAPETFLVVVAEPGYNGNLLGMALNTACAELGQTAGSDSVGAAASPGKTAPDLDRLLAGGPLAAPLAAMQTLLAKVMGPIAPIIFRETVEEWLTRHPPARSTLPALFDLLAREIGEPDKIQTYRQLITPHLQGSGKTQEKT